MSDVATLLPPNAGELARSLEQAMASDTEGFADLLANLPDPATCHRGALPFLAWAWSVDEWEADWGEEQKREAIAAALEIHRLKGTIGSVRRALAAFGFGEATITEGHGTFLRDGSIGYDGAEDHGEPDHWAEFRIYLKKAITIDQANRLKAVLHNIAPARCRLRGLFFMQAAFRHNGEILRDGNQTRGVV